MFRQCPFQDQGADATTPELSQLRDLCDWFPSGAGGIGEAEKNEMIGFSCLLSD